MPDSLEAPVPPLIVQLVPDALPESILATTDVQSWWFRSGATIAVISLLPTTEICMTVGLAADVPYHAETSHHLNELNRTDLKYGRLFLVGNDESRRGAILMQEFLPAALLDAKAPPAVDILHRVVRTVLGQADRLSGILIQRFGARGFRDDEHMFVLVCQ